MHFCMKRLRTLKSFQKFKIKIKKSKIFSGWCPFPGLSNGTTLMQIQSGRTVPLKVLSRFMYKYESNLLLVRISVCIEFFLPIGWRTFIWQKYPPKDCTIWFGLRDVGIIHSQAVIQRTIVVSPAFVEHGSAEKIAVCAHTNRDANKQED